MCKHSNRAEGLAVAKVIFPCGRLGGRTPPPRTDEVSNSGIHGVQHHAVGSAWPSRAQVAPDGCLHVPARVYRCHCRGYWHLAGPVIAQH